MTVAEPVPDQRAKVDGVAIYDPVSVADALAGHVIREQPNLVVLGPRARTGLRRLVLGSVAASVVHRSPAAAIVVPIQAG